MVPLSGLTLAVKVSTAVPERGMEHVFVAYLHRAGIHAPIVAACGCDVLAMSMIMSFRECSGN
jgi:hypothetical protein